MNFGAWNGSGGLYGSRGQVAEARRLVRKALAGKVEKLQFLDDRMLALAARFSGAFGFLTRWDLRRALELVRPVYGLMKGVPTDRPLRGAYWRKRNPPPAAMNPDRDRCGLLWLSPVAPLEGRHAVAIAEVSSRILLHHGFEPMLSFTLITDRAMICVISITYDRDQPGEDDRALACYEQLQMELGGRGYLPYRLGIQSMNSLPTGGTYANFLEGIKRLADPAGILAPGRYGVGMRGVSTRGVRSRQA